MARTLAYLLAMACGALPALAVFVALRAPRRRRLRERHLASSGPREGALALFGMFCGGMAVLTLTPRWVVWSLVDLLRGYSWNVGGYPFFEPGLMNLRPFQTFQFSVYILLGNIVMFVPFGFFSALLWRGWSWRRTLGLGLCLTGFVECWQLRVGRAFDIDDLMLNTLGTLCGFWLWLALRRLSPDFTERFHVHGDKETYE